MATKGKGTAKAALIGAIIVLVIVIAGTVWTGRSANRDTQKAVRTVSLLYLDELAGRREQVVADNLQQNIDTIRVAVDQMIDADLFGEAHRRAYQKRIKALYHLDRFAFVGESGIVYTADGPTDEIDRYSFDYHTMTEPEISVLNTEDSGKKVVIAVPITHRKFLDDMLVVCFMEIGMEQMLKGVSMQSGENNATFCNIYTSEGYPLSDAVLGGLAKEDNLLEALTRAEYEDGHSHE